MENKDLTGQAETELEKVLNVTLKVETLSGRPLGWGTPGPPSTPKHQTWACVSPMWGSGLATSASS